MRKVLFMKTSFIGSLSLKHLLRMWAGGVCSINYMEQEHVFEELCRKDYVVEFSKYLFGWRSKGWHHFHCFEPSTNLFFRCSYKLNS